jgi:hypothetical protein
MITDAELLDYVQQLQASRGDGAECCEQHVSESLRAFFSEKYGSVKNFMHGKSAHEAAAQGSSNGFTRLKKLRRALVALDRGGWERSYHQRIFHEHFITSVVRVLFKTDPAGSFERSYPRLLETNRWRETYQEILISTPRRFGKTISVCLFVAALMYAAPCVEISIYSTCKRISQKLLRNCVKFLHTIHDVLREPYMEYARKSMDEIEIIGPEGRNDYRKLNSYPSKVSTRSTQGLLPIPKDTLVPPFKSQMGFTFCVCIACKSHSAAACAACGCAGCALCANSALGCGAQRRVRRFVCGVRVRWHRFVCKLHARLRRSAALAVFAVDPTCLGAARLLVHLRMVHCTRMRVHRV